MILTLGILIISIVFFSLLFVASSLLYRRRMKITYSIKNMFPFEFTYKADFKENFYTYLFLLLFVFASIGFFATFDRTYSNGYHIFVLIAGSICSLLIIAMFMVPLTRLRLHTILAVIFFTLNFAIAGSMFIDAWRSNQEYLTPLKIVCLVIGGMILLTQFVSIINPRMTLNFKAEEKVNENGEKIMVRPKWVVLAFTEWLNIILFIINMINITIFTFTF